MVRSGSYGNSKLYPSDAYVGDVGDTPCKGVCSGVHVTTGPSLNDILVPLREAIRAKHVDEAGRLICALYDREPRDWAAVLTMDKMLPRAGAKDFVDGLTLIVNAVKIDASENGTRWTDFVRYLSAAALIQQYLVGIRRLLDTDGEQVPVDLILYEFSSFLERQTALAARHVLETRNSADLIDIRAFSAETLRTISGNAVSALTVHETLVEDLQLVIAYLGSSGDAGTSAVDVRVDSVTPKTWRLIRLATMWRTLDELYDEVVYEGWRSTEDKDVDVFTPGDVAEVRRLRIGQLRRSDQLTTAAMHQLRRADLALLESAVAAAAKTVQLPQNGIDWACDVTPTALRRVIDADRHAQVQEGLPYYFLYGQLADELVVDGGIAWRVVRAVWGALRALALVLERAVTHGQSAVAARPYSVHRDRLRRLLSDAMSLSDSDTDVALAALTFSPKHRELELWDAPLIHLGRERFLIVPAIVSIGSAVRQLENMTAQWMPQLFEKRGEELENLLVGFFERAGVPVQGSFRSFDVEFDVAVFWDGWLLLFEAKCTKSVFNARDAYRARERTEEAVGQLRRRRQFVETQWDDFKRAANHLKLPETIPSPNRIVCVAVMNIPHFSTWEVDGAVVTDEMCIQRFFSDPAIEALSDGQRLGIVGNVREEFSPAAFVEYLRRPPQVATIDGALHNEMFSISELQGLRPIRIWMTAYSPEPWSGRR